MATFVLTNISAEKVHLGDLYKTMKPGEIVTLPKRSVNDLPRWPSLQRELAAGTVTLVVTPTTDEDDSGLLSPPNAVEAGDVREVAPGDVFAVCISLRKAFLTGGGGADDVILIAADAIPYKLRILDVLVLCTTSPGASTVVLRDEIAGAGTAIATLDTGTVGRKVDAAFEGFLLEQTTAAKGLFLRRADNTVEGEAIVLARREG